MPIITINKLIKDYDLNGIAVNAIRGIDMTIDKGEFTAIAGPSGSGKTTLLNIIGGLDYPTSGSVIVGDRDLSGMSSRELSDMRLNNIGFIFQAYNLIPVLSAMENVEYILLLQGEPAPPDRADAQAVRPAADGARLPPPAYPVGDWLALAIALLLLVERLLATRAAWRAPA